jgi:Transcriptional regulatory protein, C terminal
MIRSVAPDGVLIRLLGPVAVAPKEAWQPINGRRRSAVLAALALQPGEAISTDRLVDIVWGDRAPRTAADTLRNHVSYLRGMLPRGAAIMTRSAGFRPTGSRSSRRVANRNACALVVQPLGIRAGI